MTTYQGVLIAGLIITSFFIGTTWQQLKSMKATGRQSDDLR